MSLTHEAQEMISNLSPPVKAFLYAQDETAAKAAIGVGAGGEQGPQGETGPAGPEGPAGPQGPKGDPGDTGPAGADGAAGPAGADGAAGAQGPAGPQGETGPAGADGAQGPQGIQGVPGNDGAQGPAGADGSQGIQGPAGADGAQGPQGDPGPEGPAGSVAAAWPVGSVFISVVSTNPGTLLGFGTWSAFAAGRVLVGIDAGQTEFDTVEETGGAKTVTLTAAQSGLPQHTHVQDAHTHSFLPRSGTTGSVSSIVTGTLDTSSTISGANQPHIQTATAVNQNAGPTDAAQAHSNLQPYITVYMWKRTA